ncbi:hypothetical protein [Glutamicibacter sp.]|uniref:hypothetical protein n=1 Tax=Glutamicibacter sp. TaxID=1931995 RepID=UPI002B45B99C|nr:hypothetical protein [Glutamicibacter sp.]HJX77565.1 hypothetical protein [Glutamicibacter sp.]
MLSVLTASLMALTACTGTPASVLEKQAGLEDLQIRHEQQLSAWEAEQIAIESGTFEEPAVFLEKVFNAVREVDLLDDEVLDNDGVTMEVTNAGYFSLDADGGVMDDALEFWGEHAPGTYWVLLACSGKGEVEISAFADDKRLMTTSLVCEQPLSTVKKSFELKTSAESLRVNIDPDESVRGRYEIHLYG